MTNHGRSTYVSWSNDTILELLEFSGISATTDSNEITPYGSAYRQYAPGMTDYGSISMTIATNEINEVIRLRRSYLDRLTSNLNIVTPLGFQYTFKGFITNFTHVLDRNNIYTIQVTVKLTGKPLIALFATFTILPTTGSSLLRGGSYGLFLSPSTGGDSGGEGAIWRIKTGTTYDPRTMITGNTLAISPSETQTQIIVQAQWLTEAGELTSPMEATYNITLPVPTAIAITKFEPRMEILDDADEGDNVVQTLVVAVYPTGADNNVEWEIYDEADPTEFVPETAITLIGGVLTVYGGEEGYMGSYPTVGATRTFGVKVYPTGNETMTDVQFVAITLKHNA